MVRQLREDLNKLTVEQMATVKIREVEFKTNKGNIYKTYEMDIKTTLWFSTRFDPTLRMNIVNYAFTKLEEDYYGELEKKENEIKELQKQLTIKPKTIAVNTSTINRKERSKKLNELRRLG